MVKCSFDKRNKMVRFRPGPNCNLNILEFNVYFIIDFVYKVINLIYKIKKNDL